MHNINSLEKMFCWEKNSSIPSGLSQIFLSQDFSRLENLYSIIFLVFKLFQCVWEPWEGGIFSIWRARSHSIFICWLFSSVHFKAQSQRNLQKLVRCFRCWPWKYLPLTPTKQIWNLTKYSSSKNTWLRAWLNDNAVFYKSLIEKKQQRDNCSFAWQTFWMLYIQHRSTSSNSCEQRLKQRSFASLT